jgi:hypothetical protein
MLFRTGSGDPLLSVSHILVRSGHLLKFAPNVVVYEASGLLSKVAVARTALMGRGCYMPTPLVFE